MASKNSKTNAPMSKANMLASYRTMKTIREFEWRMIKEFEAGNIPGFIHSYDGQEAIATGVCSHLLDTDFIGSTHRGHGHCIAKGCEVPDMVKEIMARSTGLCNGKGGSMHIADFSKGMLGANAIVGGAPPLCVGAALTAKSKNTGGVSVSFTGDGASNQGTVFESMNLAVVLQLPAIFVYENNGYGEATSAAYAVGSKDIAARAAAFGMPAIKVDGADFFAVHAVAKEAVERGRKGGGPTAIEASITRFGGHFVGDPQLYRADGEIETYRQELNCLKNFIDRVCAEKWLTLKALKSIDSEIQILLDNSVAEALCAPHPKPEELFENVYRSY